MIQKSEKILHTLGLKELILLNWPYYPKQSIDLMQLKYQNIHIFHRTRTYNPKTHV